MPTYEEREVERKKTLPLESPGGLGNDTDWRMQYAKIASVLHPKTYRNVIAAEQKRGKPFPVSEWAKLARPVIQVGESPGWRKAIATGLHGASGIGAFAGAPTAGPVAATEFLAGIAAPEMAPSYNPALLFMPGGKAARSVFGKAAFPLELAEKAGGAIINRIPGVKKLSALLSQKGELAKAKYSTQGPRFEPVKPEGIEKGIFPKESASLMGPKPVQARAEALGVPAPSAAPQPMPMSYAGEQLPGMPWSKTTSTLQFPFGYPANPEVEALKRISVKGKVRQGLPKGAEKEQILKYQKARKPSEVLSTQLPSEKKMQFLFNTETGATPPTIENLVTSAPVGTTSPVQAAKKVKAANNLRQIGLKEYDVKLEKPTGTKKEVDEVIAKAKEARSVGKTKKPVEGLTRKTKKVEPVTEPVGHPYLKRLVTSPTSEVFNVSKVFLDTKTKKVIGLIVSNKKSGNLMIDAKSGLQDYLKQLSKPARKPRK